MYALVYLAVFAQSHQLDAPIHTHDQAANLKEEWASYWAKVRNTFFNTGYSELGEKTEEEENAENRATECLDSIKKAIAIPPSHPHDESLIKDMASKLKKLEKPGFPLVLWCALFKGEFKGDEVRALPEGDDEVHEGAFYDKWGQLKQVQKKLESEFKKMVDEYIGANAFLLGLLENVDPELISKLRRFGHRSINQLFEQLCKNPEFGPQLAPIKLWETRFSRDDMVDLLTKIFKDVKMERGDIPDSRYKEEFFKKYNSVFRKRYYGGGGFEFWSYA